MTHKKFVKKRPYLFWSVKNPDQLSESALVEGVLNYGDFDDINDLKKLIGIEKMASIFATQIQKKRSNYSPKIKHYFSLYFKTHAPKHFQPKTD